MGDFNAISRLQDTNIVSAKSLLWPWLVNAEGSCKLVNLFRLACTGSPPPTRVSSYGNTRSYLDQIYVSHLLMPWVNGLHFSTFEFKKSSDKGLSDHVLVCISITVWGARGIKTVGSCKG